MKDVIEMAQETGFRGHRSPDMYDCMIASHRSIERFATLVEDDFKHRLAEAIEKLPFGDTAASFAAFVREFK